MQYTREMMDFIRRSPTAFHAVASIREMLEARGYSPLNECEEWEIAPGGCYYVTRNQSSIIAFRVPSSGLDHFQIVSAHSDSPCFKLKPAAGRDACGVRVLNVEKYGGMIMSTWLDRPLSVAGRVIVKTGAGYESRLVYIDRDLALIPNLPIHVNRDVNDGMKLNPQVDMQPIFGAAGADHMALVAAEAGVKKEDIVGFDLYLVNRDAPRLWGAENEFVSAPRLDDLECAYAAMRALAEAKPSGHVDVACVFDNEEVGSNTRQGADSTFLSETLCRVAAALGVGEGVAARALTRSMMLSADNAHAVHPNHPEKYDPDNRVTMNGGVVVKFNANQKYTSDGVSQAVFEGICAAAGVPVQRYANRSDFPGGSTLGNISNSHASMISVDIGLAQLAMHSANECAGARDVRHMVNAMRAFYEAEIDVAGDGVIRVQS